MNLDANAVDDPEKQSYLHAPTVPEGEQSSVAKRNFTETFERPSFSAEVKVPKYNRFKQRVMINGKQIYETRPRINGQPNPKWMLKNKLTISSHPSKWFEAFVPTQLTDKWTSYTNTKALQNNAGQKGKAYSDYTPFECDELKRFLGLYMLQGITPSPQIKMKFKDQSEDPVNGNDFVKRHFGPNSDRRHKHFKAFFGVQDPLKVVPPRKEKPMWKIEEFLAHTNRISRSAWLLGKKLSVDEQTIGFKGRHADKIRVTYKKEGDGFMCDAVCDHGYTFSFYFRNEPPPSKYSHLSSLHARCLCLFDFFEDKYHEVACDNLYVSAKFTREAYKHKAKVLIHGVCRTHGRGFPEFCIQQEKNMQQEQEKVRGTVMGARLVGDRECPDLVAISVYDTKPVHFLSMACTEVKWISKSRQVYDKIKRRMVTAKFLRLNVNNDYNYGMGYVDVADQLRGYYRFDKWTRRRKWWHSIFWWGFQVLLINSYKCYKVYMENCKLLAMNHYEFQKNIALDWISGGEHSLDSDIKGEESTASSISITNLSRSTSGVVRPRFCHASLHPITGFLRGRLNKTVGHYPVAASNTSYCQMHRWAFSKNGENIRKRKYNRVVTCSECNVNLCPGYCYEMFHEVWDLSEEKKNICKVLSA